MNIRDKVVIVTGASQGIGAEIAKTFADSGAKVVVCFKGNKKGASRILSKLHKVSPDSICFQGDLSNERKVEELFRLVIETFGRLDILINNAGFSDPKPLLQTELVDWQKAFSDNLFTTVLCSKYAVKNIKDSGKGKIINISSINGLDYCSRAGNIAYSAAKAAVINFTKSLAKYSAPNILVNAVLPGAVLTEALVSADEDFKEIAISNIPVKRFTTTQEIADICLFLVGNDSITGETIIADGGFSLLRLSYNHR